MSMSKEQVAHQLSVIVSGLTDAAANSCKTASEAVAITLAASSGPVFTAAGLLSQSFTQSPRGQHPAVSSSPEAVLFTCLLMARSYGEENGVVVLDIEIQTYIDAAADFRKLSRVPVESFLRADIIKAMSRVTDAASPSVDDLMSRLTGQAPDGSRLN